jgi:hypothetical protein
MTAMMTLVMMSNKKRGLGAHARHVCVVAKSS